MKHTWDCSSKWGKNVNQGNYRHVSLTSVPGKFLEQINLSAITWHLKGNQVIRPRHHEFIKGRSSFMSMISFYDKVTWQWMMERLRSLSTLTSARLLNTLLHSILLEKQAAHGLDRCTLGWFKSWLGGQAQRVTLNWHSQWNQTTAQKISLLTHLFSNFRTDLSHYFLYNHSIQLYHSQ